jgi:hypothetical protein
VLRGFGKQLGSSKKEIMALSKDLVINQPTGVAMEASRLAREVSDAIKESREAIRAALRDMGAASDISEASGPTRAQSAPTGRPSALMAASLGWGMKLAASSWAQRPLPARPAVSGVDPPPSGRQRRDRRHLGGRQPTPRPPRRGLPRIPCQGPR